MRPPQVFTRFARHSEVNLVRTLPADEVVRLSPMPYLTSPERGAPPFLLLAALRACRAASNEGAGPGPVPSDPTGLLRR